MTLSSFRAQKWEVPDFYIQFFIVISDVFLFCYKILKYNVAGHCNKSTEYISNLLLKFIIIIIVCKENIFQSEQVELFVLKSTI